MCSAVFARERGVALQPSPHDGGTPGGCLRNLGYLVLTRAREQVATIRGFISTAKKQGWNIIPALMENPETLIARLRDA